VKNGSNEIVSEKSSIGLRVFSIMRKIFIYLLSIFIIIAAILFAADKSPNKSLFGYRHYTVLTNSMEPEFSSGDMVFVKVSGAGSIKEGDIITFNVSSDSDAYLTHRVTQRLENYKGTGVTCFRTKGDANNSEDSFLIDESRVIGKVKFHVPKLGFIVRFVQLRWYFIFPLIILIIVFFKLMLYYFSLRDENKKTENQSVQEKNDDGHESSENVNEIPDKDSGLQKDVQEETEDSQQEPDAGLEKTNDRTEDNHEN